jgi:orotate phosphoribosyltransferase
MNDLKKQFIEFTLEHQILRFGNFSLNSGRESPYFFNTGLCNNGKLLANLADFYSSFMMKNSIEYDFIFGPAYKGITLATSISNSLYNSHNINKSFCFNRKEAKTHGEAGIFVGSAPKGNALIVDDVISSGKSIIESIDLLSANGAKPSSVVVAFDRMELGTDKRASIEILEKYKIQVYSIITLDDIIDFLNNNKMMSSELKSMTQYMELYKR